MGELHLRLPVEEQFVKQIIISASNLLFMALYPIDLEKTIDSNQTDCYIVKEFTPIIFHSEDGIGEIKIATINETFGETNGKSVEMKKRKMCLRLAWKR
jgi:hypothetical protein